MSFYDAFKDVLKTAQKADNMELYKQLLDLSAQAIDLQEENARLRNEINQLKNEKVIENRIVRHNEPYITLNDDLQTIKYCATCWDDERKLIQMREYVEATSYRRKLHCNKCRSNCVTDQ